MKEHEGMTVSCQLSNHKKKIIKPVAMPRGRKRKISFVPIPWIPNSSSEDEHQELPEAAPLVPVPEFYHDQEGNIFLHRK